MDVYIGPDGILAGAAREAQERRDQKAEVLNKQAVAERQHVIEVKRHAMEAKIAQLQAEFEAASSMEAMRIRDDMHNLEVANENNLLSANKTGQSKPRKANRGNK